MTEESTAIYTESMDPSVGFASLKDDNRVGQRGRSMVEMLGVLAIAGVLSVGGVYGYGVAMKKHKANELLHQASMLATTISAQIQSKGQLPTTIENFGDAKYGTFKKPEKANDEQFTMEITGMDSAVCEQVAKMAGGMVRKAECTETTLTLTYNNNLTSDKVAADYNGNQEECEASGRKYCDNDTCIPSSEECPCTSAIVNVYNCETKTTTPCCPDNGNTCEQPRCSCADDDDCLGGQVCVGGLCRCSLGGILSKTDPSVCCLNGFAWDQDRRGYYNVNLAACGCPPDYYTNGYRGTISETDPSVCCKDGYAWDGSRYRGYNLEACGCPDGKLKECCANETYAEENPELCGSSS